jgi:hypothetical protein
VRHINDNERLELDSVDEVEDKLLEKRFEISAFLFESL